MPWFFRQKSRDLKKVPIAVVLFRFVFWGSVGAVVFAVSAWGTLIWSVRGEKIPAPTLTGRMIEEARSIAMARGLKLRVVGERHSGLWEPGRVLEQRPPAAFPLKKGQTLSVVLSQGTERIEAPDLVGGLLPTAHQEAGRLKLRIGSVMEVHSNDTPGTVIAQEPWAGSIVFPESGLDIVVSRGPRLEAFYLPDLVGFPAQTVRARLESQGLVVRIERQSGDGVRGRVIRQRPLPGSRVERGSRITLYAAL